MRAIRGKRWQLGSGEGAFVAVDVIMTTDPGREVEPTYLSQDGSWGASYGTCASYFM